MTTAITFPEAAWASIADDLDRINAPLEQSMARSIGCALISRAMRGDGNPREPVTFDCSEEERDTIRSSARRLGLYQELGITDAALTGQKASEGSPQGQGEQA